MVGVSSQVKPRGDPMHVAIIMDGNGRWAQARKLPRSAGHAEGAKAVSRTVEASKELGVRYLTLFGFSMENWKRPLNEVKDLMQLFRIYLKKDIDKLGTEGVRLRFIGDRTLLEPDIVSLIEISECKTKQNSDLDLIVALSYGSRQEITLAAKQLARDVIGGELEPDSIDEDLLASKLSSLPLNFNYSLVTFFSNFCGRPIKMKFCPPGIGFNWESLNLHLFFLYIKSQINKDPGSG